MFDLDHLSQWDAALDSLEQPPVSFGQKYSDPDPDQDTTTDE